MGRVNGYAVTIAFLVGVMAGFVLGGVVFLGFGRARTTDEYRAGMRQDRRDGARRHCTGISARWCPIHGECTCRVSGSDEDEMRELDMDNPSCALHGRTSLHGST